MQFSAVLDIFIVKTELNSILTNDLKIKEFFFFLEKYSLRGFRYPKG